MYFSKFKKWRRKGAGEFPGWVCVFWLHWHQLLINGNVYFHSWKSYFCSFSFHSVFLIPSFIYLKGRPSRSFSTIARSGPASLWQPERGEHSDMWTLRARCTGEVALPIVPVVGTPQLLASHFIARNHPPEWFQPWKGLGVLSPNLRDVRLKVCKR